MNNPTLHEPTLPSQDAASADTTADAHTALTRREAATALTAFERLADIPEEDLWLQNQRSAHTRCAYKEDVLHFMRSFAIQSREELHKTSRAAVIAWVRKMEQEDEKPHDLSKIVGPLFPVQAPHGAAPGHAQSHRGGEASNCWWGNGCHGSL